MSLEKRKELLLQLESELDARVITLVTADRQGMETRIAPDLLPLLSSLLSFRPEGRRIALFLYTPGGDTIVGWGVVNLLRQFAKELVVVVPFKALSCGTLIALGADELHLGRHGMLSPIDPSVSSPYNPPAPEGAAPSGALLPVSVEDVSGFLALAKDELKLEGQEASVEVLKILAGKVHPLALGAVHRAREQTRSLALRLLQMHMKDQDRIEAIVSKLTKELPTHSYLLGREEAKEIGLELREPRDELEDLMWRLYSEYEEWLKMTEPYSAMLDIGADQTRRVRYERAALEMLNGEVLEQYKFISDRDLMRVQANQAGVVTEQIGQRDAYQGWRRLQDQEDGNVSLAAD